MANDTDKSNKVSPHKRLLLTTTMFVAAFSGYGRQAYAACDPSGGSSYICTGLNTNTQDITGVNNAMVSTAPGFSVDTTGGGSGGRGIRITGDGDLVYTDENYSSVTGATTGLQVTTITPGIAGSITVDTNGDISGVSGNGIRTQNDGSGFISITAEGDVTGGPGSDGIYARNNNANGTYLSIVTGPGKLVTGGKYGIEARNNGTGDLTITTKGDVNGDDGTGLRARNFNGGAVKIDTYGNVTGAGDDADGIYAINNTGGTTLSVSTATDTAVKGDADGIDVRNDGTGDLTVTARSDVSGYDGHGIKARNFNGGDVRVDTYGDVTGTGAGNNGIYARNNNSGTNLTVTTGVDTTVSGEGNGIYADNNGSGFLSVTTNGDVSGYDGYGIKAENSSNGTNLTVTTGVGTTVESYNDGIKAKNEGKGFLSITVSGDVTSKDSDGIQANNSSNGTNLTIITGVGTTVTGGNNPGIWARNDGSGYFSLTANGDVIGSSDGVFARNSSNGSGMTITTGVGTEVMGGRDGIDVENEGKGALELNINGDVTGETQYGIKAENSSNGTNLTVTTGVGTTVESFNDGIKAKNEGKGFLSITVNGDVTSEDSDGIQANNSSNGTNLTIITGVGTTVTGGNNPGIWARNDGSGYFSLTANGDVIGTSDGVFARNSSNGSGMTITTGVGTKVMGGRDGIDVENEGKGALELNINGDVTGETLSGIKAENSSNGTNLTVTTGVGTTVEGYNDGILAHNLGSGFLSVAANGDITGENGNGIDAENGGTGALTVTTGVGAAVIGSVDGIKANHSGSDSTTITVNGDVMGGSGAGVNFNGGGVSKLYNSGSIGAASDLAVKNGDYVSKTYNNGLVTGYMQLGNADDDVYNNAGGKFVARGDSDFGGQDDSFTNAGLLTLADSGGPDAVTFNNLETFTNSGGLIDLMDGGAGDTLTLSNGAGVLSFAGGGNLDIDINEDSVGDKLAINGDVTGKSTAVFAMNVDAISPAGPIDVVEVSGETEEGDFVLSEPVRNVVFDYELLLNGNGSTWQLIQGDQLDEASLYPVLSNIISGDVRQFVGSFWDRETATRGGGVNPVADIDNPYNAPTGTIGISMWGRVEGYTANGKGKINGTNPLHARYDENLGFIQGGMNIVFLNNDYGRAMASLFGHYGNSESDVKDTIGDRAGSFDIDSFGAGGALSWIGTSGFYGDLLVLYSKHDVDSRTDDGAFASTDADTWAFSAEAGWRIGMSEGFSILPNGQIVYQDSDIDNFVNPNAIPASFRDNESLEGRLGVRFLYEEPLTSINKAMRLHLRTDFVHEFKDNALTTVNGVGLGYNQKGTGFEVGAGAMFVPVTGSGIRFGGEVDYRTPFESNKGRKAYSFNGVVGVTW